MAMVLDAFASYIGDLLKQVAQEELRMMLGVSGEIDKMSVKLGDLKNFLTDAERRRIADRSVQEWVTELKRAMYDATDILDLCQLKAMERGPSAADMGCCNPLLFCLRNPLYAHDIGSRIKKLNQRLDAIKERSAAFSFLNLGSYEDRRTARPDAAQRKTDPVLERSGVVGEKIEEDTRVLVEKLRSKSDSILVVAIVGVGGIGKTTLAKKVFGDEAIEQGFNTKIWLSITKEFSEAELLRTAITAANGNLPGAGAGAGTQDKSLLVPALVSTIRDKKFFLVLDDMWHDSEWNNLLKAPFSHGALGSRVLVTTRHEIVARGMKAVHPYHHVDKLGSEDAWTLLKKQVLTNEKSEPEIDMLKDIGLQIIAKCDGLPLAVKVMGGLLCQREKERRDWEKVMNAIWSVSQMPEELNYAIYLSYEELSPCLKQCFLHFSLKPKKTDLSYGQIVAMWIGEGFVHGNSDRLEELGSEYYMELILRNLIEPDTKIAGLYVSHMHDVVRSFAQFVARDEALVAHNGEFDNSKLSSQRFLRLSIETKGVESDEFEWKFLQEQKSLRTLILTGNFKFQPADSLITFSSLRILHIESANCAALVESMYQLRHLRYLAVRWTDISRLPENIYKMKFLQHISLEGCESLIKLPDSIVKLRELRYLDLAYTSVNSMPRGFCALTNLRTLFGFPAHMDGDWCSLEELGPLSQLMVLAIDGLENVSATSFVAKARLGAKVHLTALGLDCSSKPRDDGLVKGGVSEEEKRRIEEVFEGLCPPTCLEYLQITRYFGRQLPGWMMSMATAPLKSLRILRMHDLACCTQLPDGLCQLPCLEFLEVYRAPAIKRVGPEFVQPYNQRHHPSSQAAAAFLRLHNMILSRMVEWEEWEWEAEGQAMPVLETLKLSRCNLRCIPPGLASHARALKKLTMDNVQRLHCLENFASVVELEMYGIPDLTRITNFPKLQKLEISYCPKLKSLQRMTALRRLVLKDEDMEELPLYLRNVKPMHLLLGCSLELLTSMAAGKSGPEWVKFSHIQQVEAYAKDGEDEKKWHVLYTSEPYSMETNIEPSSGGSKRMKRNRP